MTVIQFSGLCWNTLVTYVAYGYLCLFSFVVPCLDECGRDAYTTALEGFSCPYGVDPLRQLRPP